MRVKTNDGPRQIIIEVSGDGKDIVLRKDETASFFERNAILSTVIQMPDIKIIPITNDPPPPAPLQSNQTNEKENGKRNKRSKNSK